MKSNHNFREVESQDVVNESVSSREEPDKRKPDTQPTKATASENAKADAKASLSTDRLNPASMVDRLNPAPEETVGERFGEISIHTISDGELERDGSYRHWDLLEESCVAAVQAKATLPYRGRRTNGDLMGTAMERLKAEHNVNVPKPWLPIMKKLREGGPAQVQPERATIETEDPRICEGIRWAAKGAGVSITVCLEEIVAYQHDFGTPENPQALEKFLAGLLADSACLIPELESMRTWVQGEIERIESQRIVKRHVEDIESQPVVNRQGIQP